VWVPGITDIYRKDMQNYIRKIKQFLYRVKIWLKRFFKKMHPRALRRAFKYHTSRSNEGYVGMSAGMREYVDTLTRLSEVAEQGYIIRSTEKASEKDGRAYMSVPFVQARFLEVFVRSLGAKHALEIGTFRGFSTAFIARGLTADGIVFSCDEDPRPMPAARRFWQAFGVEEKIHFEFGEAKKVLEKLTSDEPSLNFFDVVFIDADKENYKHYVTECMKLLRVGGTMLIDNTLWKGLVQYKESHDNSAEYMKEFNAWLFENYTRNVSIVPAWDGLTLLVKTE
jgi:O-methyltransferase